jgi:hypothetical protein
MNTLALTVLSDHHAAALSFPVRRVVNAGYVGRNQQAVRAHIEELAREGVAPPPAVPMLFPLSATCLTADSRIDVIGSRTSGEAEFVLLLDKGQIFVGVGSDHTDRDLETQSIIKSKQICLNVMSAEVWRYDDVRDHWDELVLRSLVREPESGEEILYQEAALGTILNPQALLDLVRSRLRDRDEEGMAIFSGTVPLKKPHPHYGEYFRAELFDPNSANRLTCESHAVKLDYLEAAGE